MPLRRFGNRNVELSDLDKVLFPEIGLTKGGLIDYYADIAETLLPHARGRPLTLQRFPDGVDQEGFYQQRRSDYFPDWIATASTPRAGDRRERVDHVVCNDQATLAYLANQATVTLHGWLARDEDIDHPDRLIFDLDPPGDDFAPVKQAAQWVREIMEAVGMTAYVMTTGSRGLHVVAPLRPETDFDNTRDYAREMAHALADRHPDELTTEQRKNKRRGRIYLDVMRNAYGQTAVLPYSVRARARAPVATPLSWNEMKRSNLQSQSYTVANIFRRLGQRSDPWRDIDRHAVSLSKLRPPASALRN